MWASRLWCTTIHLRNEEGWSPDFIVLAPGLSCAKCLSNSWVFLIKQSHTFEASAQLISYFFKIYPLVTMMILFPRPAQHLPPGHCRPLPGLPALPLFLFTCSQPSSQEDILKSQITSLLHHVLILLGSKSLQYPQDPMHWLPLPLTSLTSHPPVINRDYVGHASTFFAVLLWSNTLTLFFYLNRHVFGNFAANYKGVTSPPV